MKEKNFLSIIVFIAIICGIIIGGNYLIKNGRAVETKKEVNLKKDKEEDYVYFTNEEVISSTLDIVYKDININIDSQDVSNLEKELNQKMDSIRDSYIKLSSVNIEEKDIILEIDDEDIYQAEFMNYEILESNNYISLLVSTGFVDVTNDENGSKTSAYTISKSSGKILSNEDILTLTDISTETLDNKLISYDGIINSYTLYFDKYQKVYANLLVESDTMTYNDSIKIN